MNILHLCSKYIRSVQWIYHICTVNISICMVNTSNLYNDHIRFVHWIYPICMVNTSNLFNDPVTSVQWVYLYILLRVKQNTETRSLIQNKMQRDLYFGTDIIGFSHCFCYKISWVSCEWLYVIFRYHHVTSVSRYVSYRCTPIYVQGIYHICKILFTQTIHKITKWNCISYLLQLEL